MFWREALYLGTSIRAWNCSAILLCLELWNYSTILLRLKLRLRGSMEPRCPYCTKKLCELNKKKYNKLGIKIQNFYKIF